MKKGLKFDKAKAKKFLILNVEKFVFGLSMVIVAGLIYAGLTSEPYTKTPADVESVVKRARANIGTLTKVPEEKYGIKPPKFSERAKRAADSVPGESFPALVLGKHPTIRSGEKRREPEFLPVKELVVSSGVGPFAFINLNAPQQTQQLTPMPGGNPMLPGAALPGMPTPQQRQPAPKKPKGKQSLKELFSQPQGAAGAGAVAGMPGMEAGIMPGMEAGIMPGMEAGMMPGGDPGMMPGGMGGEGMTGSQGVTAPPNSEVKGVQWVCLTALVPHRDQVDKYFDTFENAGYTDQTKDYPDYLMYLVQRADVTDNPSADPETLKWQSLQVVTELERTRRWAVAAPEVINPALTDPDLLFPLGPLLGRGWGKEVAHPKIPIMEVAMTGDMGMGAAMAGEPGAAGGTGTGLTPDIINFEEAKERSDLDFLRKLPKSSGNARGGMGAEAGMPGGLPGGMPGGAVGGGTGMSSVLGGLQRSGGMPGMEGMGAGMGAGLDPGMGMGMPGMEGMAGGLMPGQMEPEHKLMRFFDFNVEKGRLYRYRVQLVMANPNQDLPGQFLADASLAKKPYCLTPWSEPSPVAEVTSYGYVLAGPVTPARTGAEPEARAVVVQFDQEMGVKATDECRRPQPKEKKVMGPLNRGQFIHYTAEIDVVHPLTHQAAQTEMEFSLDLVLLDLKGGEDYAPNDKRNRDKLPGELLFLTPNGRLMVRSELEDEREFNAEVSMLQRLKDARENKSAFPMGGGLPGEIMPGMPGVMP